MSRHTIHYLNAGNILIGNGHRAWWYDQRLEDPTNPTHYEGPIPVGDVKRRLFGWQALESIKLVATVQFSDGTIREILCDDYKAIVREDTEAVLHIHGADYNPHQFGKTLIESTSSILGDTLVVDSAGLLKFGAVAWLQVSIPQDLHNDTAGFAYRPKLLAATSFDGSLASTWKRVCTFTVCDNTFDMAMSESNAGIYKRRHTNGSNQDDMVRDARSALGIVERAGDEMDALITAWAETPVSDRQFQAWLDLTVPVPVIEPGKNTRSRSLAENKRDRLVSLWSSDSRVAPWNGTKFGVLQLVSTFSQHENTARGTKKFDGNDVQARVERNMLNVLGNKQAQTDAEALRQLDLVLANS